MADAPQHKSRERRLTTVTKQERARNRRIARALGLFVAVVFAFGAGFLVRGQTAFVASLGFPVEGVTATNVSTTVKTSYSFVSSRIEEVEDLLAERSLDDYDLQEATSGMITAMMKSTGDPYAMYFDSARYENYIKETTLRPYTGIGVLFADYNGHAYVVDVFEGSEAEAKGVQQGDFVVAIDGDGSRSWTVTEVVNSLARGDGESAIVTWMRPISLDAETGSEYMTTLECKAHSVTNVTSELMDGNVGYIKVRQITQNATELVRTAVEDLTNEGATSFVLDIRDNPGGYLTQATNIASLFLQSGVLVEIETVDGVSTKTASGVTVTAAPLVVLVNEYTSAGAEVLAAALQDNQRAQVIGTTTMGKGAVPVVRELSFGGAVRYTAAYYRTPLGHDINGVGIVPNVSVNSDGESQLVVAADTARSLA